MAHSSTLELGLIGNCAISALIDPLGEIVWSCFPRFDAEPIFCSLLTAGGQEDPQGTFRVELDDCISSEQHYVHNTAILKTRLLDSEGNGVEITDFCPRFHHFGRTHRPTSVIRKLTPIGSPLIRILLRPSYADGAKAFKKCQGSHHIRFVGDDIALRLTTNLAVSTVMDEKKFVLRESKYFILGADESVQESIENLAERFLRETRIYWTEWVRYLAIPFEWQEEVIRAAITLKLSAYEDSGAIVAAMTTSIPEAAHSARNWDYRFCWLRDSFFTVHALNRLGVTRTMEQYLEYLVNIVGTAQGEHLQPVYCINGSPHMPERIITGLPGYRGMGPVRIGNQAAEQVQHDVYGAVILSATQMFFDERIHRHGDKTLFRLLEKLGDIAVRCFDKPDAGLWELRGAQHVHTFSSMMCWAGADRLAKIALKLQMPDRHAHWQQLADKLRKDINAHGFNQKLHSYTAAWDGDTLDASLLLACELGFVEGTDPRFVGTLKAVEKHLKPDGSAYLFRYIVEDDFGEPENAFTICSFWYIDALAAAGRKNEARALFEDLLGRRNRLGLMSEDLDPQTGELWGNFPQTYSMVGIINSARILSKSWEEAF